ncbi:nucleotidyl transferase AbiEii/AbiGii toxin family protein [Pedobacter steynii]|uniref:nucleotidyl transferase AbiEii/AbiGii toxin family protein n=1 Tax=Pedobacter steynii TaxID=430522 RepID=UPI000941F44B|nr:nucleotidyl transferase AbiEii/AbiGii toxin family protein [Pedobacter steynii]NQX38739.1 nucleotidyl transferase AbiEii/AbiGii toxin family protein [Pedobacter steynii]
MLHKETVKPGILDLIQKLMKDQQLKSFYFVGGTALSRRAGHRQSIDIDLFNSSDFDGNQLALHL